MNRGEVHIVSPSSARASNAIGSACHIASCLMLHDGGEGCYGQITNIYKLYTFLGLVCCN